MYNEKEIRGSEGRMRWGTCPVNPAYSRNWGGMAGVVRSMGVELVELREWSGNAAVLANDIAPMRMGKVKCIVHGI